MGTGPMNDEKLKMILKVFGSQLADDEAGVTEVVHLLMDATVKFRDKLKGEAGITLSVEDTQTALDGFEVALSGEPLPSDLTSEQQALAQIFLDRMTLFKES